MGNSTRFVVAPFNFKARPYSSFFFNNIKKNEPRSKTHWKYHEISKFKRIAFGLSQRIKTYKNGVAQLAGYKLFWPQSTMNMSLLESF